MKKAIHQIAAEILAEHKRAMSAAEIYEVMVVRGLYEFKAKNPKSVLRSQLRRHSKTSTESSESTNPIFFMSNEGLFELT